MKLNNLITRFLGLAFGCLLVLVVPSCLDEIDFQQADNIDNGIAIQGKIVKGSPSFVSVTTRRVFNFEDAPRLINVREVTVIDENGTELELNSNADGIYFLEIPDDHPTFKVEFGQSYQLRVATFDNREFESSLDELFPAPVPDDLSVARTQIETNDVNGNPTLFDQLTYTVSTPLLPENSNTKARLLYEMIFTYQFSDTPDAYGTRSCRPTAIDEEPKTCYLTTSPSTNFLVVNGPGVSVDRLDDYEVLNSPLTPLYAEGLYLTVIQQSLSQPAFNYWQQVNQVVNRTGDIFQAPAGKVQSNFININDSRDEVFGYFYATEESTQRIFVSPEMADNPARPCPAPTDDFGRAPSDCCNCLTITGSTTERPSWWVF